MRTSLLVALALGWTPLAQGQAAVKPDGQFRAVLGLGLSAASGNSDATHLSITGDGVRATARDKLSLFGKLEYARTDGKTTAEQLRLGGRYDRNLGDRWLAFGGLGIERNKFSNLELRSTLSGGLGWHALKSPDTTWDLFGGLGYTAERYFDPRQVDGATRASYDYASLMLGEESTHVISGTTRAKQRLTLEPNLKNTGEFRANWDAGLSVSMNQKMSLTVGLSVAHNSDPGPGFKTTDTLLTTGIALKFE